MNPAGRFEWSRLRLTSALAAAALLVALLPPGARAALLDTRSGVQAGEIWRLWSGHWVHFSTGHLAWNLLAFALIGGLLEARHPRLMLACCTLLPPWIGVALLWIEPRMVAYGGLSGLVTGLAAALALAELAAVGTRRWPWLAMLALIAAKTAAEWTSGRALFSDLEGSGVRIAPVAHLAGALGAAAIAGLAELARRRQLRARAPDGRR